MEKKVVVDGIRQNVRGGRRLLSVVEIEGLIVQVVYEFRARDGDSSIYGDGGMDSMTLVLFIAELEIRLAEKTGCDLVLASERAMSRSESPYRDVRALAQFVEELLRESAQK